MIIQGSFTTDLFNYFVEVVVLLHWNVFPGPKSVLVMDNAPIHRSEVKKLTIRLNRF